MLENAIFFETVADEKAVFGHFARQKAYKPRIYGFSGYRHTINIAPFPLFVKL